MAKKQLNLRSIDSYTWWSHYHKNCSWQDYPDACYLKNNLLALPVHHQLGERHIDHTMPASQGSSGQLT